MSNNLIIRSKRDVINNEYDNVCHMIWNNVSLLHDDHVCLIEALSGEQLTVSELKTRANSIAVALIERGINKTDKIAFCGQNSIQHSILLFVGFMTGNASLPIPLDVLGKAEMKEVLTSVGINILFIYDQSLHEFRDVIKDMEKQIKLVIVFDGQSEEYLTYGQLVNEGKDQTLKQIPYFDITDSNEPALYGHTSGTTGQTKCLWRSHRALCYELRNLFTPLTPGSVVGILYPLGFITGYRMLYITVMNGGTGVIFSDRELQSSGKLLAAIEKYSIRTLYSVPRVLDTLHDHGEKCSYDLSSLTEVIVCAFAIHDITARSVIEKYDIVLKNVYGSNETGVVAIGTDDHGQYTPGCVGCLASGVEMKIVDLNTGECLGADTDGEVVVRTNSMFTTYVNNAEKTKAVLDSEGWYKTGDVGHYDREHRLFLTDRVSEFINVGFFKLSPTEVENHLLRHPSIADAVVVGVEHSNGHQTPRAFVALKEGQTTSAADIKQFVSDLSSHKQLNDVVFVDRIQKTGVGKIDRKYYKGLVRDVFIG